MPNSWLNRIDFGSLLPNSIITFSMRVSAAFAVYLMYILLARFMEPAELGYFVLVQAALWLAASVASLGLISGVNRYIPSAVATGALSVVKGYISWSRRTILISGVSIAMISAAVIFLIDRDFSSHYSPLFLTAAVSIPFAALINLNAQISRSMNWIVFASLLSTFLRPALLLLILTGAFIGFRISATPLLVLQVQLGLMVILLLTQFLILNRKLLAFNLPTKGTTEKREWIKTSLILLFAEIYFAFYIDIHVLISGLILDASSLAIFNAVLRTLSIVAFASAAVGVAFAPKVANLIAKNDLRNLKRVARHAISIAFWPSLVIIGFIMLFSDEILTLFGQKYVIGAEALTISAIAQLAIAISTPLVPMLGMSGHHRDLLKISLGTAVTVVLSHLILTSTFGVAGSAAALVISSVIWTVALIRCVSMRLGINLIWDNTGSSK